MIRAWWWTKRSPARLLHGGASHRHNGLRWSHIIAVLERFGVGFPPERLKTLFLALVVVNCCALAGCASNPITDAYKARDRLFAPDPLNEPASEQIFADAYAKARDLAQRDPTPANIVSFVDSGNAKSAVSCNAWIRRDMGARRGITASDKTIGILGGLFTALAGILEWNPVAVAVTGVVQTGFSAFGKAAVESLGAPSIYQAQTAVRSLLAQCSDQLAADAPTLTFGRAYGRLEACAATCSAEAAQSLADRALVAGQAK